MTLHRTESFVPLTTAPASGDRQALHVTVLSEAKQVQHFKSLELPAATHAGGATASGKTCEPRVSVQREGDRITSLRIQCGCGQVMDLACVYETASPAK